MYTILSFQQTQFSTKCYVSGPFRLVEIKNTLMQKKKIHEKKTQFDLLKKKRFYKVKTNFQRDYNLKKQNISILEFGSSTIEHHHVDSRNTMHTTDFFLLMIHIEITNLKSKKTNLKVELNKTSFNPLLLK
ncbi:unnamed protein product [Meganyctiphanes norvegica]|uniref:Uncharacterized protein n=1 Tax=Meganyctiphanes norvegica TaxID=48144 RepID=A0AAV2QI91_MEGNR